MYRAFVLRRESTLYNTLRRARSGRARGTATRYAGLFPMGTLAGLRLRFRVTPGQTNGSTT